MFVRLDTEQQHRPGVCQNLDNEAAIGHLTKIFPNIPPKGAPAPKQPKAMSFVRPGGNVFPRMPRAVGAMAAAARP